MEASTKNEFSAASAVTTILNVSKYLLSKWFVIMGVGLIFGIAGVLYAWLTKPIYVAEMSFVAENESAGKMGMYAGLAAQFGLDIGSSSSSAFEGDNLIELLKSRTLIEKTLLTRSSSGPLLIDDYLLNNNISKDWKSDPKYSTVVFEANPKSFNRTRDSILLEVYKKITNSSLDIAKKDKKINIITIRLRDRNEDFSKQFVEALASNAITYYTDYKVKKSRQNVDILQHQTDSVKSMLFGSITQVATLNDLNVNPIRQSVRVGAQRKQVDAQVNSTMYGELLKNLELAKLSLRRETPLIQIIDAPKLPLEKIKPGRLLTGIIFAIVGSILAVIFLVTINWVRQIYPRAVK